MTSVVPAFWSESEVELPPAQVIRLEAQGGGLLGAEGIRDFRPAALVRARRKAKLSQEELAQRIGTYRQHVTAWETGTRRPSPALLVRIAAAVGVDPLALTAAGKRPSLADLRARKGLSQIRVAELLGIPRSTYSLIERGGILHEAVAARLAETLDVTVEEVAAAHTRPPSRPGTRDR
jgi:transcriptional regulator with XRE-family HTH domain